MATNSFGNRIFMQPMGMVKRGRGGVCSHQVPNAFTSGSQNVPQVLKVFTKMFPKHPKAPHFYPILFGYGSTSMYIICNENHHSSSPKAIL
jgi:hypothetical protein